MSGWHEKIYEIVETGNNSVASKIYDWAMLVFIVISIVPLAFREQNIWFEWFDKVSVSIFIIDYLLRWMTADYRMPERPKWVAFLTYPFTAFAIVDLLSILPSVLVVNKALKLFRITRFFKILRVFKFIRYSKNVQILFKVLRKERHILFTVFWIALFYILITALIMFNVEESTMFEDFFDALYWATTTLTTVGYGDIYPATDLGRVISMISAILGVAVIALPSGVITASYLEELRETNKEKETEE
ncbi:MAG: ion transporter [Paludibacteraceae bacterium]|nr:ion transporter [Paludibacteraceae bacterium]